jgi:hypothetical protein
MADRPEVVVAIVDLEAADAALEAGVEAEKVADIAHLPHAAHVHRLVEGDPRKETLPSMD